MIEDLYDIPYIARHAFREKQIQQNYRPIIAVHKWFARRPGTLFRGLLLAEFGTGPVSESFLKSNQFDGLRVADPFMGGGTPLIEANRLGCDVIGIDINPMAYWIVRQELEHLDLGLYRAEADRLLQGLTRQIGDYYKTKCRCGREASVKYFLWVKQQQCPTCKKHVDLSPGFLLAKDTRHTSYVIICHQCGELNERDRLDKLGQCDSCSEKLRLEGHAGRGKTECPFCHSTSTYPAGGEPPQHRMHAIEYHCERCRPTHKGRFFKKADRRDLAKFDDAKLRLKRMRCRFIPDDRIPEGDETRRLHRWGYHFYREMFNPRQLVGLEIAARHITKVPDERVRNALSTNLSDLLRYQNLLCRYDTMALKSLDIFSVHGFPVSLVQCESNMLGITRNGGGNVGSGGWSNIINKFEKAKEFCDHPFETIKNGRSKSVVFTEGEWIGDCQNGTAKRTMDIRCEDASQTRLKANSLDAVLTDPPYFGMVQYAELMDFCYVWLRRIVGEGLKAFETHSTRHINELTGNQTEGRGIEHFTDGLSAAFRAMADALKPGSPLAFTFHHNQLSSYAAIGVAILDTRLACTATFPCPAEMGGSIHIANTASSILDSVFVCRKGVASPRSPRNPGPVLTSTLAKDVAHLAAAEYEVSPGDLNCLLNGHICRIAIHRLFPKWQSNLPVEKKLDTFGQTAAQLVDRDAVLDAVKRSSSKSRTRKTRQLPFIEV